MKYALLLIACAYSSLHASESSSTNTVPTNSELNAKYDQCMRSAAAHEILGINEQSNKKTAKLAMQEIQAQYDHRINGQLDPHKALTICRAAICAYYKHSQTVR